MSIADKIKGRLASREEVDPVMFALETTRLALEHYSRGMMAAQAAARWVDLSQYAETTIRQSRGATLKFLGKLLCETEFDTRRGDPIAMTLRLYETPAGAWIAVSTSEAGDGHVETFATVVEPGGDEVDRRCEVMAAWDWHHTARKMVRQQLGWRFVKEIA